MQRLDQLLHQKGYFPSRERARRAVMAGCVEVDGQRVDKPGKSVASTAGLVVLEDPEPYVSRGGRKLAGALDHFGLDVRDLVCLDVGASTGGFTDCLLQRGARRVYAVDVGYGFLDYSLRSDPRVVVMERVNARHLEPGAIPEAADLATLDLSFISLIKVAPAVVLQLAKAGLLLALVKPQFEVGRGAVGKGGIVRDEAARRAVIEERVGQLAALGFAIEGVRDSDVRGAKGNREAFALLRRIP